MSFIRLIHIIMNGLDAPQQSEAGLAAWRTGSHLRHLVGVWSHVGCDAQKHLRMLAHLLWDLAKHSRIQTTQLNKKKKKCLAPGRND